MGSQTKGQEREDALRALGAELSTLATELRAVAVDAAAAFDQPVTASGFQLLQWLGNHGPARASEIADGLDIDRSVVSRLVRQLVDAGLVSTRQGEGDGRSVVCGLTRFGRDQIALAVARKGDRFIKRTRQFTDAEIRHLTELLRRLTSSGDTG